MTVPISTHDESHIKLGLGARRGAVVDGLATATRPGNPSLEEIGASFVYGLHEFC